MILLTSVHEPVQLWCANESGKRHQQRPKGEAAKLRASEQPIFTHLNFERACMKIWCILNRNSANRCREYDRCGVASPWPMSLRYFWGNFWSDKGELTCGYDLRRKEHFDTSYPARNDLEQRSDGPYGHFQGHTQ